MPDDIVLVVYERENRRAEVMRWTHGWLTICSLGSEVKLRMERDDATKARQHAREWVENRRQSADLAWKARSVRERNPAKRRGRRRKEEVCHD